MKTTFVGLNKAEMVLAICEGEMSQEIAEKETTIPKRVFSLWKKLVGCSSLKFSNDTLLFWATVPETSEHMNSLVIDMLDYWSRVVYFDGEQKGKLNALKDIYQLHESYKNLKAVVDFIVARENERLNGNLTHFQRNSVKKFLKLLSNE